MTHPYKSQPDSAFWSKRVSECFNVQDLTANQTLLREGDKVASIGSCFASRLEPYIKQYGFEYINTEVRTEQHAKFSYDKFSAAYGNVYTPRQFLQLLKRAFMPHCRGEYWHTPYRGVVDPFRPGLLYPPTTLPEYFLLNETHLACVREVFRRASVVIFTLGLTEAWENVQDGSVYPACPGTVAGKFNPATHRFHNFNVLEVVRDLEAIRNTLNSFNPRARLILTVSPVPLVATATADHVLTASTYSKSVLRAACGELCQIYPDITYFPAYEIVTGPQAPDDFFEADRRNVSKKGVDAVMRAFFAGREHIEPAVYATTDNYSERMSADLAKRECEEQASDR